MTLCGPGTYQPTREKKLKAVESYLTRLQYLLLPFESVASSHLWHNDLHEGNIIVNPSNLTEIVGLIDWQSTEAALLYFQARRLHLMDYAGPSVRGLERLRLQATNEELDPASKEDVEILYLKQSLCALYNALIHRDNFMKLLNFSMSQASCSSYSHVIYSSMAKRPTSHKSLS